MDNLRKDVIKCLALLEALIDFGEGEDLEEGVYDQGSSLLNEPLAHFTQRLVIAIEEVQALVRTIESHLADARRGEIVRSGIKLSIFGPPNAGKSSLLNFLCMCFTVVWLPHEVSSVRSNSSKGRSHRHPDSWDHERHPVTFTRYWWPSYHHFRYRRAPADPGSGREHRYRACPPNVSPGNEIDC